MPNNTDDLHKLADLIKEIKFAMFTTVDTDGTLRSRPMATQKTEFDGNLWFFTRASSHKTTEIDEHYEVNVGYAHPGSNTYVSVSGKAQLVRDGAKNKELWNPALKAWFPEGLEDSELALIRVAVEKAEYWDSPASPVVQIVGFAKAIATGQSYKPGPGEHGEIKM